MRTSNSTTVTHDNASLWWGGGLHACKVPAQSAQNYRVIVICIQLTPYRFTRCTPIRSHLICIGKSQIFGRRDKPSIQKKKLQVNRSSDCEDISRERSTPCGGSTHPGYESPVFEARRALDVYETPGDFSYG